MVEAWGGRKNLWELTLTGGIVPLRGLRESMEVASARRDFGHVQRDWAQLMSDEKHRDMVKYVIHHENGRVDAVKYAQHFLQLMQNCTYDVLMIKRILEAISKEDEKLEAEGVPRTQIASLKDKVRRALNIINSNLRRVSDELGRLTKE